MMRGLVLPVGLLLLASPVQGMQSGGIETFAAETLFDQGTRVSLTSITERKNDLYSGSHRTSNPNRLKYDEQRYVLGIDYGLRPDVTLSFLLPHVTKRSQSRTQTLRSSGVGDAAVLGKFRLLKDNWKQGSFQVSFVGGVETPTGTTSAHDKGIRLPVPMQPGRGAWNPFVALSTTLNRNRARYDAVAFFKVNTEGSQDFEKGDFASFEVDAAYRFLHNKYPGPTASARIGLQWRYDGRDSVSGNSLGDSGGTALLVRPGLSWHPTPATDVSLKLDIPLRQHVNGTQLALDNRLFMAVGLRF
jgi:hypothetical protein